MRKPITLYSTPVSVNVERTPHEGFNVLLYRPKWSKLREWMYGYDIMDAVKDSFKDCADIKFVEVDGTANMDDIYPYIDAYIRPSRHDGDPRMVRECIMLGIPTNQSTEIPEIINFIKTGE